MHIVFNPKQSGPMIALSPLFGSRASVGRLGNCSRQGRAVVEEERVSKLRSWDYGLMEDY